MDICQKEAVGAIVIGESKDFKGNDNFIMNDVRKLAKALETKVGISVFLEPEFLTSRQAAQIQGAHSKLDASSATIILQSYLDKQTYRKSQMN
jgi:RNase H-fold protein (predicted Holliday junction resolvase)